MKIQNNFQPTFEGESVNVLSTDNRTLLSRESRMNKANISMYSKKLKEKSCLINNRQGGYKVNDILMVEPVGNIVEYTFTLDMEE